jgi:glycosyltransferase involved in cell wall biosynthesis
MKISIIIPIYNVAAYIERCLLSVMSQLYQNIECILVDDASPDNSMEIAQKVMASYSGKITFQLISQATNQGVSVARNKGIKKATGEYIYFLDADDELPSDALKTLATAGSIYDADIIIGEIKVVGTRQSPIPPMPITKETYWQQAEVFSSFLKKQWYDMAGNKLIKKTAFNHWEKPFQHGIIHVEDSLFSFQLASKCRSIVIIPEVTYYYHVNNQSVTQQKTKKNIASIYMVIQKMLEYAYRENLFASYDELPNYFEKQRVYFIKSLLRGKFDKRYIHEQRYQIDTLYKKWVWKSKSRKLEFVLKEFILLLWIFLKH